jgi:periodic tryptophan protein 1
MNVDPEPKRNADDLSQYDLDNYDNDAKADG